MVSSIVNGATANTVGVDPRLTRTPSQGGTIGQDKSSSQDRVEISGPAALAASRDSVANGLSQVQQALSVARDAQSTLLQVQSGDLSGDDVTSALQDYATNYSDAAQSNVLVTGQDISVNAEPGSPPITISGADLSLNGLGLSGNPSAGDTQSALDRLQSVTDSLGDASSALQAHQGFLGAAQNAVSSVSDLNADSARLLALQVRQGLEASRGAIANVEPQAVLALFRA
jgi:hypothetical protein